MRSIHQGLLLAACQFASQLASADLGPLADPAWGGPASDSTVYVGINLIANNNEFATSSLVQPDGKLVLAGLALAVATPTAQYDLAIARLDATTGTPDASFGGGDGRQNMNLVPSSNPRIAQDSNGRLLVSSQQTQSSALLARLTDDGSFDTSFDQDGKKFISAGTFLDGASELADTPIILPQAGGKYLIFASAYRNGPPFNLCVGAIRLNANGYIDPTFAAGEGRFCKAPVYETLNAAQVLSVGTASDGDLLLAGAAYHSGSSVYDMSVLKVSTEGVPDTTFGEDGWAFVPFDEGGNLIDAASTVATDSSGRIILGGSAYVGTDARAAAIARLTSDGQLDSSFAQGGKMLVDLGPITMFSNYSIVRIAILGADQILLAGPAEEGSFLAMLTENGMFNPQFGVDGRYLSPRATGADMRWTGDYVYSVGSGRNPANNRTEFAASRRIVPLFRGGFE